jgi:galactokinase/mevalonate kinase-like predicted kinase
MEPSERSTHRPPLLLSLPPAAVGLAPLLAERRDGPVFVASDPPGRQLGSGGGTAALLWNAFRTDGPAADADFVRWLDASARLLIHGSGESRRLSAYGPLGKPLTPLPILPLDVPQRPDAILLDLQTETADRVLRAAPPRYRLLLACGDVHVHFSRWLPVFPEADVLIAGLPASPEEGQHHGVMVTEPHRTDRMTRFLQKPAPDVIRDLSRSASCWLDTGIWLFSRRAIEVLLAKCGWDARSGAFRNGAPDAYDLFAAYGPALGVTPVLPDPDVSPLSCAVLPLPDGRFYHFGTNRSLLASAHHLASPEIARRSFGHGTTTAAPGAVVLHAEAPSAPAQTWIESATIPAGWQLTERHILTGIPRNAAAIRLPPGVCVSAVPVVGGGTALRTYGFDDPVRGRMDNPATLWMERPIGSWLQARQLAPADFGAGPETDVFDAALFPVLPGDELDAEMLRWMTDPAPAPGDATRARWIRSRRVSGRDLLRIADTDRQIAQRRAHAQRHEPTAAVWAEAPPRLDFEAAALDPAWDRAPAPAGGGLPAAHYGMFKAAQTRRLGRSGADACEAESFDALRSLLVGQAERTPALPRRNVLEDQIVWGRSPVRLDLAGGWTDTPPYCLEHGGRVVNVAVDLNGQPPIQAFARLTSEPVITIRSIDLGLVEEVRTHDELGRLGKLGSGFGIARAALALAGFSPRFAAGRRHETLRGQLDATLGGGMDLSLLAAVPKGSGLGTSSILAATVLGTLGELLGLGWSHRDLVLRTLALEQLLGSGGGWQDQVGGITRGLKQAETQPGPVQDPELRWLPGQFFGDAYADRTVLLYYTGITRVAHGILNEIVRGLFLNSGRHVGLIREIGENAAFAADALQRGDWNGLCETVRRSWVLNRRLDAGTNPAPVQAIVGQIADYAAAVKLLGAGGGGYLLILAKDPAAAIEIRRRLEATPPNAGARFVSVRLSETGFQVTRS